MNILFLDLVGLVLLIGGPIVGYQVAMYRMVSVRWKVVGSSAAGGAAASGVFIGLLFLAELLPTAQKSRLFGAVLTSLAVYALFGFVLGAAGLFPRRAGTPRLVVTGLALAGLITGIRIAVNKAMHRPPTQGASGVVFGPNGAPAAGASLFLDRGSGPIERLTTDAAGRFRAARGRIGAPQPLLLICVPGGVPYVARPIETLLTPARYQIPALPDHAIVSYGVKALGWKRPIPRECLAGSLEQ